MKPLLIVTSDSLSTMSLCEWKIASELKLLCHNADLLGMVVATPVISTIFIMMITLLTMANSWGEMVFNFSTISPKWTVSKIQTWREELTAHWVRPLFQYYLYIMYIMPTHNHHIICTSCLHIIIIILLVAFAVYGLK